MGGVVLMAGRIVVVGDLVNDVVVIPRGAARFDTDTDARIQPRPGGSAANTAAWAGSVGAAVDFVGVAGSADGELHAELLRHAGVVPHIHLEPGMPTATIVLVVEGQSRSMFTDRGANAALRSELLTDGLLDDAAVLHVSGYSITKDNARGAPLTMIARALARGVSVTVDPSSTGYLTDYGTERFLDELHGVEVLFPNLAEGALLTGRDDPWAIGDVLLERFPLVVLKRGPQGATVFRREREPFSVAAPRVANFVDPTGAGDAFAAGFLARWVQDGDPEAAVQQAVGVAARAVMLVGGRPPV
jgi:sugar/nucleoside kinase (ribokinase family)